MLRQIPNVEDCISFIEIDDDDHLIGEDDNRSHVSDVELDEELDIYKQINAKYGEQNSTHNLRKGKERT